MPAKAYELWRIRMVSTTKPIPLNEETLLTRKDVCNVLHIGISSLDSLATYKELKRIKIGRHTFFLKEDVMQFILNHRTGETK